MKIRSMTSTPMRQTRVAKLISYGSDRRPTRAALMAEDGRFLALMSQGAKSRKSSVKLVREGR